MLLVIDKLENVIGFTWEQAMQVVVRTGTNIIIAAVIFIVGWWLAKWAGKTVRNILTKSKTDTGLVTFLSSLVTILLKVLVVVTAITQLGVQMTSFVAILGAAGLAIGMAFSGTLSNFAGGVMILLFKPFKVGDTIMTQTQQGKVVEIQIFYTYLHTSDNKVIILPNGPVANGNIVNFTKEKKRRVDWVISISYGDDYVTAHTLLEEWLKEDKRVLKEPAPFVALGALTEGAVELTVRAWAKTDEFWPVFYALNKRVYEEFPDHGLNFPQKDDATLPPKSPSATPSGPSNTPPAVPLKLPKKKP